MGIGVSAEGSRLRVCTRLDVGADVSAFGQCVTGGCEYRRAHLTYWSTTHKILVNGMRADISTFGQRLADGQEGGSLYCGSLR